MGRREPAGENRPSKDVAFWRTPLPYTARIAGFAAPVAAATDSGTSGTGKQRLGVEEAEVVTFVLCPFIG